MTIERDPVFGHWNARCDGGCGRIEEVEDEQQANDGTDVVTDDDESIVCAALSGMGWLIRFDLNKRAIKHMCPDCKADHQRKIDD